MRRSGPVTGLVLAAVVGVFAALGPSFAAARRADPGSAATLGSDAARPASGGSPTTLPRPAIGLDAPAGATSPPPTLHANAVEFVPIDPSRSAIDAVGVGEYRGSLTVTPDGPGLAVVNDVGFQDYLLGLAEMPRTWPLQALEAQVIAARTYALWEMLAKVPSPWRAVGAQICASAACQVYRGLDAERAPGSLDWAFAVADTAGQVLLWHGLVIPALYGSSDGGETVSGGVPWLPAVPDPQDAWSPLHTWQWSAPLGAFAPLIGVAPPDRLAALVSNGSSIEATVVAPDGGQATVSLNAEAFYERMNATFPTPAGLPEPLPSRRFSLSTEGGQVVVRGGGWGNLEGMSQYGALGKALEGMSAAQILASYYGGIEPTTLPPNELPSSIRVEVAAGRPEVEVRSADPFRVLDARGAPLAVLGKGTWVVTPGAGGGVEVRPPAADAGPLEVTVDPLGTDAVRVAVSLPSLVEVAVERPGATPLDLPQRLVGRGALVEPLPPGLPVGTTLTVEADAGAGRVVAVPTALGPSPAVAAPAATTAKLAALARSATSPAGDAPAGWRSLPSTVAVALLVLAAAATAFGAARPRRRATALAPAGTRTAPPAQPRRPRSDGGPVAAAPGTGPQSAPSGVTPTAPSGVTPVGQLTPVPPRPQ
jgi:stage II sporulation protein D